jgi:hypothetical protein
LIKQGIDSNESIDLLKILDSDSFFKILSDTTDRKYKMKKTLKVLGVLINKLSLQLIPNERR